MAAADLHCTGRGIASRAENLDDETPLIPCTTVALCTPLRHVHLFLELRQLLLLGNQSFSGTMISEMSTTEKRGTLPDPPPTVHLLYDLDPHVV
jgi:hypothetical protein